MKINLFLSVVSVFTVFHLCKAGPLRHLQKRAAFYIANETACVVDNIVYTNGDPIPTDDPCEACRCRPPGFACVLKECKIKPGCRAVRHAGQCCPEYICGCEHNGKFYKDGDEIKDPKNPCYQCYCQGSSIACAFVDCIYRDECDSVYVPGECCPTYTNCTRDIPDRNLFLGGNIVPPVNLLPTFNDGFVLPEVLPTDTAVESLEIPTNPIPPQETNKNDEEAFSPEISESDDESSKSETAEPESSVTTVENLETEVIEKDTESLQSSEENQDLPKESEDKVTIELTEEPKLLLNSESDVNNDDISENSEEQDIKVTTEEEKELPQTTVESKSEEIVDRVEATEKPSEIESTSTEITEKEPQIKNSASENSKSLKLTDNDTPEEQKNEQHTIKSDTQAVAAAITELEPKLTSVVPKDDLKENTTMENKKQSENVAEESQTNAQATPLHINNAKIKSESAETVTIVVHVKESSKIPTETDFIAETVTPVSMISVSEENILKSNDEVVSTSNKKELSEDEDKKSTNTNFEIFPTTQKISDTEVASKSPSTDQSLQDIQGRSDEADNIALEAEENPVSEEKLSNLKTEDNSPPLTTTMSAVTEEKHVRTNEDIMDETKVNEPTNTVIRIDASRPITVEIISDSVSSPKPEKSTTEIENEKIEKITEEKEPKNDKTEEVVEAAAPELREDAINTEKNVEDTTPVQSGEESTKVEEKPTQTEKIESTTKEEVLTPEEKVQESTPTNIDEKPEIRSDGESVEEKNDKMTNDGSTEEKTTKESKPEAITESQNQATEEPKQTTLSDNQ